MSGSCIGEDRGRLLEFTSTLKKNYEFRRLYSKGKSCANAYLVVYCRKNHSGRSRIGYTVSNKVGHAVVSRVRACAADYHQLETAFLSACAKLGLLTEGDGGA